MIDDGEHLFMSLLAIYISSLDKCLFSCLFMAELSEFFIHSGHDTPIYDFTHKSICKYFLPVCGLPFHFLDDVLWNTKAFHFDEINLSVFSLIAFAVNVVSKRSLPNQRLQRFIPEHFS